METYNNLMQLSKRQLVEKILEGNNKEVLETPAPTNAPKEDITFHTMWEKPVNSGEYLLKFQVGDGTMRYMVRPYDPVSGFRWSELWGSLKGWVYLRSE